jgi:hypothetical protein
MASLEAERRVNVNAQWHVGWARGRRLQDAIRCGHVLLVPAGERWVGGYEEVALAPFGRIDLVPMNNVIHHLPRSPQQ